ncbi:MAG: polyprenyl synthetase family protein [Desulfobacteraceae bacterium]|nr:polyprenyl synthetase family protein [Desulfobacteraceae bacterium]MBC2755845.1 polyprenyl synthetase family protein [Desulfobacteraceae bacterium]
MQDSLLNRKFNLSHYLNTQRNITDQALSKIIKANFSDCRLSSAMQYSLIASGKRLRPVLCMAAAETVGEINDDVVMAACAIEMIHTYSLIHDDLPAMDDDKLRRGKPTCHIQYDEATAILAGDALLTLAFEILSDQPSLPENSSIRLQVIKTIARAAGHNGMIEGQMRDIEAETAFIPLDELKKIHQLKTGALIEASVIAGAQLAGGTTESVKQLKIYAGNIGVAFQVIDDILNVEGDAAKMGKATGTDAFRNKSTYPGLLGMEKSRRFAAELINNALHALDIFGNKAIPLSALAEYIIKRER